MQYFLFLVHIGPIQTFIASARRTRDLYYGSNLLSELSKLVASILAQKYGIEKLIFPAPASSDELNMGSSLNVSNKILVQLPADADPGAIGTDIRQEIQAYLKRRWIQLKKDIEREIKVPGIEKELQLCGEKAQLHRNWLGHRCATDREYG